MSQKHIKVKGLDLSRKEVEGLIKALSEGLNSAWINTRYFNEQVEDVQTSSNMYTEPMNVKNFEAMIDEATGKDKSAYITIDPADWHTDSYQQNPSRSRSIDVSQSVPVAPARWMLNPDVSPYPSCLVFIPIAYSLHRCPVCGDSPPVARHGVPAPFAVSDVLSIDCHGIHVQIDMNYVRNDIEMNVKVAALVRAWDMAAEMYGMDLAQAIDFLEHRDDHRDAPPDRMLVNPRLFRYMDRDIAHWFTAGA